MVSAALKVVHRLSQATNKSYTRLFHQQTTFRQVAPPQIQHAEIITPSSSESGLRENQVGVDPLLYPDYFGVHKMVSLKELFLARVHLGHKEGTLHENMNPFVFGSRLGHLIIDLDQTVYHLQEALNITAHIAYKGGIILFAAHSPQHTLLVEKTAKEAGEYAHARDWRAMVFTNAEKRYGGVTRLPDLCILLSTLNPLNQEHPLVLDAAKLCIPTVGIVDTNSNPNLVTYPVPGNDDSPSSVQLYCRLFRDAILAGKNKRKENLKEQPS